MARAFCSIILHHLGHVDRSPQLGVLHKQDVAVLRANSHVVGGEPVVIRHEMMLTLLEAEGFKHAFGQLAHPEEAVADDTNDGVILRVKRHLRDGTLGRAQVLKHSDHLALLPEEVDETGVQDRTLPGPPFALENCPFNDAFYLKSGSPP